MSVTYKAIGEARQGLLSLSQSAKNKLERFVITQNGQPQSVLLGYRDYMGMLEAIKLLQRPDLVQEITNGLTALRSGEGVIFDLEEKQKSHGIADSA
jgi:PHD/YefM family antitoxin component YafN of YafNO toxin-antitoxin module